MVSEIRLYIEGGGTTNATRKQLREGFHTFFREIVAAMRQRKLRFSIILGGTRNETYEDFCRAARTHRDAHCFLLVDSEKEVSGHPKQHLIFSDGWHELTSVADDRCHLMVRIMEAWFLCDTDALRRYYGQGFRDNAIRVGPSVEVIPKSDVLNMLESAIAGTSKRSYEKIKHATDLLERIDPARAREKSRHCQRLFAALTELAAQTGV